MAQDKLTATPTQINSLAQRMGSLGAEINAELTKAYNEFDQLKSAWKGKGYNNLANAFTEAKPTIDSALMFLAQTTPNNTSIAAFNIANSPLGNGGINKVQFSSNPVTAPTTTPEEPIEWDPNIVHNTRNSISSSFDKVVGQLSPYEGFINQLPWGGSEGQNFRTNFNMHKNRINETISNIKTSFQRYMDETHSTVQGTMRPSINLDGQ